MVNGNGCGLSVAALREEWTSDGAGYHELYGTRALPQLILVHVGTVLNVRPFIVGRPP